MRKRILILIIVILKICTSFVFADVELTDEEKKWLEDNKVIKYSPDRDYAPFEYLNEKGEMKGLFKDYLDIIEKELEVEFEIKTYDTWTELLEGVKNRQTDVIAAAYTKERFKYLNFTEEMINIQTGLIVKNNVEKKLTMSDLEDYTIGVVTGWVTEAYLKEKYPNLKLATYTYAGDLLKAVSFGEIDVAILNLGTASYEIEKNRLVNLKVAGTSDFDYDMNFAVRKDYKILVDIINKVLKEIPESKKKEIYDKWIKIEKISFYNIKYFVGIIGSIGLLVFMSFIWNMFLKREVAKRTKQLEEELEKSEKMKMEIKEKNNQIEESRKILRKTIDFIPHMVFIRDIEGHFILANDYVSNKLKIEEEKLEGMTLRDLKDIISKDKIEALIKRDKKVIESLKVMKIEKEEVEDLEGEKMYYSLSKIPIDITGIELPCVLTVGVDITNEIKAAEEIRRAQRIVMESEKSVMLGSMVAGIAHEISTPIGLSVLTISHIKEKYENIRKQFESGTMKKSEFKKNIENIGEAIDIIEINLKRASEQINNFKTISANQVSNNKETFKICECIQESIKSMKHEYKRKKHVINLSCDVDLEVYSIPGAFSQIIINLVMNSLKHGFIDRENGKIDIEVSKEFDMLKLKYKDDGVGMSEEHKRKMFEPFFTTKSKEGGTGLGMHIVYNIVNESLGGEIYCESEIGKGVKFEILIPMKMNKNN